jgi:hypothetical protein
MTHEPLPKEKMIDAAILYERMQAPASRRFAKARA